MYYSGHVHSVIYDDPSQAFYILKMELEQDEFKTPEQMQVTVRGNVPGMTVQVGSWFGFEARWTEHKTYGKQLVITKAPILINGWDADTAEKVLVSNGVGNRLVGLIRSHFGDVEFLKALNDEKKLAEVPGVDSFTALYVAQRWRTTQTHFQTLSFLRDLDLPSGKIKQIWGTFGEDAEKILSTNPWALVQIDGISFANADSIASKIGLDFDTPERVRGAVLYVIKEQKSFGHLYLVSGQLFAEVSRYVPSVTKEAIADALAGHFKAGNITLDRETRSGVTAIYEPWAWEMEKASAGMLLARQANAAYGKGGLDVKDYIHRLASVGSLTEKESKKKKAKLEKVLEVAVEEWGKSAHIVLSEKQKQGVLNALREPVSILTGLPGTGKTTSLRAVVSILQEAGATFLLCAPTGIAAKNLSALTGAPAYTIHRAFSAKGINDEKREFTYTGVVGEADSKIGTGEDGEWGFDVDAPHPAEVVVIDESSMLDQHLIYRLLSCTSPQCRMVIVGDAAQLPSVGPGNVLRDLVGSGQFPVVDLREIFRQKDTSDIVYAAHAIFRGEVPELQEKSDFSLVQVRSEEEALSIILQLAQKLYSNRANFQILSPRHAGVVGVTNLNARLRELLNPQQAGLLEIRLGSDTIREDDRVMVVRNDYKLGVYNGDVGKVARIDRKAKEVEIKIFGEPPLHVRVPFKTVPSLLRMAYACTVHKAQGLEYDCIVMPIIDGFKHQLQRNLLYTAITRAKKKAILVGTSTALATAVGNDKEDLRNTLFRDRLQKKDTVESPKGVVPNEASAPKEAVNG